MSREIPAGEVTQLLLRWRAGDEAAFSALLPMVYEVLRTMAQRHLGRERGPHTLQRTALVHEAFLRMVDQTQVDWQGRSQFYGIASQMMRRVLVDHARRRNSDKRGGRQVHVDLDAALASGAEGASNADDDVDFDAVHQSLQRLEALDSQQGRLVELRFFGGLSIQDAAAVLGISPATAKREWAIARAFLHRELSGGASS